MTLWLVLNTRPTEGRRLSWTRWLGEILRCFARRKMVTHRSTSRGCWESNLQPSSRESNTLTTRLLRQPKQQHRQTGWLLQPDCAPRSECPQLGMPAERCAQFQVPNVPRSRVSESAPFLIYEHAQCRVFERICLQCAYVTPCRQQMGSSAVLRARRSALVTAASMQCLRRAHSIGRGCCVHT